MTPLTARERLRAYLVQHPGASAAQAAAALNISRQRAHVLGNEEGLEFGRGSAPAPRDLGSALAAPPLTEQASTGPGDATRAAGLRVAADLTARGFEVYVPAHDATTYRLVVHDPGTGRFEGVNVGLVKTGKMAVRYDALATGLTALVKADQSIEYRPPFSP